MRLTLSPRWLRFLFTSCWRALAATRKHFPRLGKASLAALGSALFLVGMPWRSTREALSPTPLSPRADVAKRVIEALGRNPIQKRLLLERPLGASSSTLRVGSYALAPVGGGAEREPSAHVVVARAEFALLLGPHGETEGLLPRLGCDGWHSFALAGTAVALVLDRPGKYLLGPLSLESSLFQRIGCIPGELHP